jgi:subtilisin family serine protease
MISRWVWPWLRRGRNDAARSRGAAGNLVRKSPRKTFLEVEALEGRLVPSTVHSPTLSQWRHEHYSIANMKVVHPSAQLTSALATAATSTLQGGPLIGLDQMDANYPYRGGGYAVAVIDTGIDYTNPAFGNRVIAGWNFVNNTANYMDDNGHGTGVAGVIAGSDGIAPSANLIALKVLDAGGAGSFGAVQSALDWVVAHQQQYNIVAVNMSLGAGNYTSNPYTFLDSDLQKLTGEGVFIAVASGNDFYPDNSRPGLAFPAVDPNVASVGAVWDGNFGEVRWANGAIDYSTAADDITSFTQRDSNLDILAPGAMVTTLALKNGTQSLAGTSIATPFITGAAVILHQELDALGEHSLATENSILSIMQATGKTIVDSGTNANVRPTGLTFKRLDLYAAVQSIAGNTSTAPTLDPIANQIIGVNQTLALTLSGNDSDGDPLTYTAQIQGGQSQSATAYHLKQQLGLTYAGSYYTNSWGLNEKWLQGSGGQWYIILPVGELRKWSSTLTATLAPAALIATFDPSYYNDPSRLWNAQPATAPAISISVTGNQVRIQPPSGYTGTFTVQVTVSDGQASASQSFQVTVAAGSPPIGGTTGPTLGAIPDQTVKDGGTVTVNLVAASSNSLTFTAAVQNEISIAYQLKKQYSLAYGGSYYTNSWGLNEKWLVGANSQWFLILPDGELRRWQGTVSATLSSAGLVANLGAAFYSNPSLLWQAQQAPPIDVQMTGSTLTIHVRTGFIGTFDVSVTVNDGSGTATQTFTVTVNP